MSENIIQKGKKDKRFFLFVFGAAIGVCLLIFGSMQAKKEKNADAETADPASLDPAAYAEAVEEEVTAICSQVKGAGTVRTAVTLKGGYRSVYASDSKTTGTGYQNSMVLVGSGSSEQAVLICYENPEIAGIGIVCTGGDDPAVRQTIISLVSAAFDIGSHKIYVATGRQS